MKLYVFTKKDIDRFLLECNFTPDEENMTQKQSYRSGKSEDCKRKMLAALEEHLDELTTEMSDMSKDAECREERDLVKRYVEKLRDML